MLTISSLGFCASLLQVLSVSAFTVNHPASCCEVLKEHLQEKVFSLSSNVYNTSLSTYWSDRESDLHPACIVRPTSAKDVSTAIKILRKLNPGGYPACPFAVRGGGHTAWPGSANIESGVTIDLRALNGVTIAPDRKFVSVGGGAIWSEIYGPMDKQNLAIVGGRDSTVGAGGLVLGGGISFFSARFGFVCDNIDSYELVTSNGSIESISSTYKPDLFRALKGGSSNFGIVTNFKFRAFDSANFLGGQIIYDWSTVDRQFEEFAKLAGSGKNYDPYAAVIASLSWSSQGRFAVNTIQYTQVPARNETPAFLQGLVNVQPRLQNTLRIAPLSSFTDELAAQTSMTGPRPNFVTFSYQNNADFAKRFTALVEESNMRLNQTVAGFYATLSFQPVPQAIIEKSMHTGGNVLGLGPKDTNLVNVLYSAFWAKAEDDELISHEYQKLTETSVKLAKKMGVYSKYVYLNYAERFQDPFSGYGAKEVAFLRSVSRKYDSHGFWQKAMPGGFKLW